jgi:hypothetical protein
MNDKAKKCFWWIIPVLSALALAASWLFSLLRRGSGDAAGNAIDAIETPQQIAASAQAQIDATAAEIKKDSDEALAARFNALGAKTKDGDT